jgi:hypothetical protein
VTRAREYAPSDDAALVHLAALPMPGWVRLRYDYAEGYAAAEALKGTRTEIVVVTDGEGRLEGCGTRSSRRVYLDGRPARLGYLSGLRSFARFRRGFGFFRGLQLLQRLEHETPDDLTFTTILAGNAEGRALLTSGRAGLPKYVPHGKAVTLMVPRLSGAEPERATREELAAFYARAAPNRQLFPVFDGELPPGLEVSDFLVLRQDGAIVAAAAVWSHGMRRRIVVDGYGRLASAVRPLVNAFARLTGRPRLPSAGAAFDGSYLAYALVEGNDPALFAKLVRAARTACRTANLVLALHDSDPLLAAVKGLPAWRYTSEFLTVEFNGSVRPLAGVPHIEAGAL